MGHFVVFSNTALRKEETNMAVVRTHEDPLYVAQSMHDFQQIELLNMPIHIENQTPLWKTFMVNVTQEAYGSNPLGQKQLIVVLM